MKIYAPKYYKDFRCIADACEHSCCIGWEIDIDTDTMKTYRKLKGSYAPAIRKSISMDGTPHFKLRENGRCPHLDERGLCRIILHVGEDYLCDICREHPRFYNFTDALEIGLGMSCPEAARLILSSPDYAVMEELGVTDTEADGIAFDGRAARAELYDILSGAESYRAALERIYREYGIEAGEDSAWLALLDRMEYLNADHKPLCMTYASASRPAAGVCDAYLERFLAYLIYRHCTEAADREDFCERLAFCLFCERLLASLLSARAAETLAEAVVLASMLSEEIEYSDDNTALLMEGASQ